MPAREKEIITEARVTLNDSASHRWTDERLMKLLCDAQQELCREVPLVTKQTHISIFPGQEFYKLPSDAIMILTARAQGTFVPTVSMEALDNINPDWEDERAGKIYYLVVNNLSQREFRPFPLLADGAETIQLKVRYSAKPPKLGWDSNTLDSVNSLVVDDTWDYALTQYVISKAFIDYGDASSLSRAQVAQSLYTQVFDSAKKKARKSFSKKIVRTDYQAKVASNSALIGERYGYTNR